MPKSIKQKRQEAIVRAKNQIINIEIARGKTKPGSKEHEKLTDRIATIQIIIDNTDSNLTIAPNRSSKNIRKSIKKRASLKLRSQK